MPRKRVRKTEREQNDIRKYQDANEEVKRGTSIREACMKLITSGVTFFFNYWTTDKILVFVHRQMSTL